MHLYKFIAFLIKFPQYVLPASEYPVLHHHKAVYTFQFQNNLLDYIDSVPNNFASKNLLVQK